MKHSWLLMACVLVFIHLCPFGYSGDIDDIKVRLINDYISSIDNSSAESWKNSQNTNGSWNDINYQDNSIGVWEPIKHLARLMVMSAAYSDSSSTLYQSSELCNSISLGLDYWYSIAPYSDNLWYNIIGKQINLAAIIFLMENQLSEAQKALVINDMAEDVDDWTGQNKIWLAQQIIWKGLLENNSSGITYGVDKIEETIAFTYPEGLQVDYSFFQHGKLLYNGGYGVGFIVDNAYLASILAGTSFAMRQDKIQLLSRAMLEGYSWMIRNNMLNYSTLGRTISRADQTATVFCSACSTLATLDSTHATELNNLVNHITNGATTTITGNKYFPSSHFLAHVRQSYYMSLKMDSIHTVATETANTENLKGKWLSLGVTYISLDGTEYYNIMPVWDWARLPGVTNPYFVAGGDEGQSTLFVGGVSNGSCGAATMDLNYENTQGQKSWFFFDDEMVALGAGISSSASQPINTTVNQCFLDGAVIVNGNTLASGEHSLSSVSWVQHDDIGYVFPEGANVKIKNQSQSGSWYSINQVESTSVISEEVFTLWFDHGTTPSNSSYEYIVIPNKSASEVSAYSSSCPIQVISNTTSIQAVRHNTQLLSEIVFHQPGSIRLHSNLTVKCNIPALVMIDESTSTPQVNIKSPSGLPMIATINLIYDNAQDINMTVGLEAEAAKSYEPITFYASADSFGQSGDYADNNYGSNTYIIVKNQSGSTDRKSYVKFNIPQFRQIRNARLRIYCNGLWNGASQVSAYKMSSSWQEETITYNNAPSFDNKLSTITISEASKYYDIDVSDYVREMCSIGEISFGLYSEDANGVVIASRENNTRAPELILTFPSVIYPTDDSFVQFSTPDDNFGSSTNLIVKYGTSTTRKSMLKFPISSVNKVNNAKLRLYCAGLWSTPTNISVCAYTSDWAESLITYSNMSSMGTKLFTVNIDSINQYFEFDVTDYVRNALGDDYISFELSTNEALGVVFRSKESENKPELVIDEGFFLSPQADAFVASACPDNNYGSHGLLAVKCAENDDIRSFLKFDLSGMPQVTNAKLRVYCGGLWNGAIDVSAYAYQCEWTEANITYNNMQPLGPELSSCYIDTDEQYYDWDVSSEVMQQQPNMQVGLALYQDTINGVSFCSKEQPKLQPELIINAPMALTPYEDAYVANGIDSQLNFGSSTYMTVANDNLGDSDCRSYIKFDLNGIKSISHAKLKIYCQSMFSVPVQLFLYEVTDTWEEDCITYENAPSFGNQTAKAIAMESGSWIEVDVTSWVRSQRASGCVSFGIYSNSTDDVTMCSKEGTESQRPQLIICP